MRLLIQEQESLSPVSSEMLPNSTKESESSNTPAVSTRQEASLCPGLHAQPPTPPWGCPGDAGSVLLQPPDGLGLAITHSPWWEIRAKLAPSFSATRDMVTLSARRRSACRGKPGGRPRCPSPPVPPCPARAHLWGRGGGGGAGRQAAPRTPGTGQGSSPLEVPAAPGTRRHQR